MTGYIVECRFDVVVTEISYEKRSSKTVSGCKIVKEIIGRCYYVPGRIDSSRVHENLAGALREAFRQALGKVDYFKREANAWNSMATQVEKLLRSVQK